MKVLIIKILLGCSVLVTTWALGRGHGKKEGIVEGIQQGREQYHVDLIHDLKLMQPGEAPILLYPPDYEFKIKDKKYP